LAKKGQKVKKTFLFLMLIASSSFALMLGQTPPEVVLEGKNGGRVDGTPWSSQMLKGKVHVLFYVDPDKKDLNEAFSKALKAKQFPHDKYQSVAIVNMAATWMPNFAIEAKLKAKQKKYPNAIYVKDKKKVLVKKWALEDDNSDILVFDKEGKLIFQHAGKLDETQIENILALISHNLEK
jgi:YtfJ family uncharacterized protein